MFLENSSPKESVDIISQKQWNLEEAITLYGNNLLRLCFMYLKDRDLAEDAVQDTFIKAYRGYHNFRKQSSEKTWLTRIAINVCKDYLRKSKFIFINDEEALSQIPCVQEDYSIEEKENIIKEILRLPPKYKEVVLLYYYQELKISEIAQILHVPKGTVSTRLKRARQRLKENLKEWYYEEPYEI